MGRLAVRASSLKSINPPALKGYLLVRKPGDFKWLWGEQPLSGPDEFSAAVLRELVGGDVRRFTLTDDIALISDKDAAAKKLPPSVALVTAKGTFTFLGPVALVRTTATRVLPLRREDRDFLLKRFKWGSV